jgi:ABC-type multidrug transport system permease subunit
MASKFLRRALALDALSCAAMGAVMAPAGGLLSPLLGLSEGLIRGAGFALLPLALFIGWLATRPSPPRAGVWIVIVGNLAWTAESFLVIGQAAPAITAVGTAFVAAQALAVLGLAALEYVGLRRMTAAT